MKYHLHIYVDGRLVFKSIHDTYNDAKKQYVEIRGYYPSGTLGSRPKGVVTWEIIEIDEK